MPPSISRRKVFIIYGLGGIGKTQLARWFTHKYHGNYSATFWLDGSSEDQLRGSFEKAMLRKDQHTANITKASRISESEDSSAAVAKRFLDWLADPSNKRWLLIIDNMDRDTCWKGKNCKDKNCKVRNHRKYDLEKYFPADHGSILITSRSTLFGVNRNMLTLQKVNKSDAKEILENAAKRQITDPEPILKRLSGLPLALTLTGSYLRETGTSTPDYIELYDKQHRRLMELCGEMALDDLRMDTTWNISYEKLEHESEEAAGLLRLWGFLDCRDLWHGLLAPASSHYQAQDIPAPPWLRCLADDEFEFRKAMICLSRYSLLYAEDSTVRRSVHPVLHMWCRDLAERVDEGWMLSWLAAQMVGQMASNAGDWKLLRRLLPHASRAFETIQNQSLKTIREADICYELGELFSHYGKLGESERMFYLAQNGYIKFGREEDPKTMTAMIRLARTFHDQAKFKDAENAQRGVLRSMQASGGDTYRDTISAKLRLANILHDQAQVEEETEFKEQLLAEAATLSESALKTATANYDDEDPLALSAKHSLAIIRRDQGRLDEAAQSLETVAETMKRIFGEQDPRTILVTGDLVITLSEQENIEEAVPKLQGTLQGMIQFIGDDHPVMYSLTKALDDEDKLDEAAEILRTTLQRMRSVVGKHDQFMDSVTRVLTDGGKLDEKAIVKDMRATLRRVLNMGPPSITSAPNSPLHSLVGQDQNRILYGIRATMGAMMRLVDDVTEAITSACFADGGERRRGFEPPPPKSSDLTEYVEKEGREWQNCNGDVHALFDRRTPSALSASGEEQAWAADPKHDWVESGDGPLKLLMCFKSTVIVNIHGIDLISLGNVSMRPKTISLYRNCMHMPDSNEKREPTQLIELNQKDWKNETGTVRLNLIRPRFKNVSSLLLSVVDVNEAGEKVRLDRIQIFGSYVISRPVV